MPNFNLIKSIVSDKDKNEYRDYTETAYNYWNLNHHDKSLIHTKSVRDLLVQTREESDFYEESSLGMTLTLQALPYLTSWANDPRSIRLMNPKRILLPEDVENGVPEELTPQELNDIENEVRESFKDEKLQDFFLQKMVTGTGVFSVAANDTGFVPLSSNVYADYENDKYVYIDRKVPTDFMDFLLTESVNVPVDDESGDEAEDVPYEMYLWYTNATEEDYEQLAYALNLDDNQGAINDLAEIKHGQYSVVEGEWVEFIEYKNVIFARYLPYSVMHHQFFTRSVEDRHPMGTFELCSGEELETTRIKRIIRNRIQEVANATLFVDGANIKGKSDVLQQMYNNSIIDIDMSDGNSFQWAPSRVPDIEHFRNELLRLEETARTNTGLHKVPNVLGGSNTTALEAKQVFEASTRKMRSMIEAFMPVYAKAIQHVILRDYGIEVEAKYVRNPVDLVLAARGAETAIPMLMSVLEKDPHGQVLGGVVDGNVMSELVYTFFDYHNLNVDTLKTPWETSLSSQQAAIEAQNAEKDAAQKIADAELKKADALYLQAQASKERNIVEAAELELKKGIHNDGLAFDQANLQFKIKQHSDETKVSLLELDWKKRKKKKDD